MAMLITSIRKMEEQCSPNGFKLFCQEQGINPENYVEPEEGVCVDSLDLLRYGAKKEFVALKHSVRKLTCTEF